MRRFILFALLALLLPACSGSATNTVPTPTQMVIEPTPTPTPPLSPPGPPPVTFVDALHGWSAEDSVVIATADGGHHWQKRGDLQSRIFSLDFTSIDNGWGATQAGLFSTVDGGMTWQPVLSSQTVGRVDFVAQEDGWLGTDSAFLRTRDGGRTWTAVDAPCQWKGDPPDSGAFSFVTIEVGFTLCAAHVNGPGFAGKQLYRTDDGGVHWSLISEAVLPQQTPSPIGGLPAGGYATDLHFLNEDVGWLSENRGFVFATHDGGRTWKSLPPAAEEDQFLPTVVFVSPSTGWVVSWPTYGHGDDTQVAGLYATTDGGATWRTLCIGDFLKCGS